MNKFEMLSDLLDTLKFVTEEELRLESVGITIESIGKVETVVFDCIKNVIGMPKKEEEGIFISDIWFDMVFDYAQGKQDKKHVITELINWNKE